VIKFLSFLKRLVRQSSLKHNEFDSVERSNKNGGASIIMYGHVARMTSLRRIL